MTKLVWVIVLLCVLYRMLNGYWPWHTGEEARRGKALQQARSRLGLGRKPSRQQVMDAHRTALTTAHPDRGGSSEQVHEVNAARDLLLAELDRLPASR